MLARTYYIREMFGTDISANYLNISQNDIKTEQKINDAREIFQQQLRCGMRNFVAIRDGQIIATLSFWIEPNIDLGFIGHMINWRFSNTNDDKVVVLNALIDHVLVVGRKKCNIISLSCNKSFAEVMTYRGFRHSQYIMDHVPNQLTNQETMPGQIDYAGLRNMLNTAQSDSIWIPSGVLNNTLCNKLEGQCKCGKTHTLEQWPIDFLNQVIRRSLAHSNNPMGQYNVPHPQ